MTDEEFNRHKKALSDQKLEKPKKLSARHDKIWNEIASNRYNFNRVDIEVGDLEVITRDDVLRFYDTFIAIDAPERRKLAVHVFSTVEEEVEEKPSAEEDKIEEKIGRRIKDVVRFKASRPLNPTNQPFVELDTLRRSFDPIP